MSEARQLREGAAREAEERRKVAALDVAQVRRRATRAAP